MSEDALLRPAYTPLPIKREFYAAAALTTGRQLVESFTVPPRSGRAWKVSAGHVFRLSTPEGPQVGDLNLWNADDPRESPIFGVYSDFGPPEHDNSKRPMSPRMTDFGRLSLSLMRPMATIVYDSLRDYGVDADGGRVHDLLGTRCDPYVNKYLTGIDRDVHCHSNLTRAIQPFGLTEFDVHDVLNVFQCTGLNAEDKYFMKTSPATVDTYIEFFAEQDLICALSTCPGGDLSIRMWVEGVQDGDDPALECCRPLRVEVFRLPEETLSNWRPWDLESYTGKHGLGQ